MSKDMGLNTIYREAEVFSNMTNSWVPIDFRSLKKGNRFRLFEPDTREPVQDDGGNREWHCASNAEMDPDTGVYYVNVENNK